MAVNVQTSERGLKCGKCRSYVVAIQGQYSKSSTDPSLWALDQENLPEWIQTLVDESGWTKGRIACPSERCHARIGSFDFVGAAAVPVNIIKSKVDEFGVKDHALASTIERRSGRVLEEMESTSSQQPDDVVASSVPYPRFGDSSDSDMFYYHDHCSWSTTSSSYGDDDEENAGGEDDDDGEARANVVEVDMVFSQGDYRLLSRRPRRCKLKAKKYRKKKEKKRRMTFEEKKEKDQKFIQNILDAEPELDKIDPCLICPVCLDLLHDPYAAVPCKHVFCETCLRRLGSKNAMETLCPMCRQRIAFCEEQKDLGENIRHQFSDLYNRRKKFERSSPNVYALPLPWRPGWRNLISGRPMGGNQFDGQGTVQILSRIVQHLPYYIPPVVLANLVNLVFFVFLLFAVEVVPFILNLFMKKPSGPHPHLNRNLEVSKELSVDELAMRASGSGEKPEDQGTAPFSGDALFPPPEDVSTVMDTTLHYAFYFVVVMAGFLGNFYLTQHVRENRVRINGVSDLFLSLPTSRFKRAILLIAFSLFILFPAILGLILYSGCLRELFHVERIRTVLNVVIQFMINITDFFTSYYGVPVVVALVAFLF